MKKLLTLSLAIIMVFSLIGCSMPGAESKPSRGNTRGHTYVSEYLGLQFTKPTSWTYYTDAQIESAMDLSAGILDEELAQALENNPTIYDMMVVSSNGTNVSLSYENLVKTLNVFISEEKYLAVAKEQLLQTSGMSVTFDEGYEKVMLGDKEYTRATATTSISGISMRQGIYVRKIGGYMNIITITIMNGYTFESIEAMFSTISEAD